MGLNGLDWQTIQIPLAAGVQTKGDPRAQNPPGLDIARDVEFDEIGGLRTRKPYAALGVNILGGGTLTNLRKIVENGNELLAFTDTGLYSWDAAGSVWISKGRYLAPTLDERPLMATTSDQYNVETAVFGGVMFVAWNDATTNGVTMAVLDRTTGAVIVAPFTFISSTGAPRFVTLNTRVMLFYVGSNQTHVAAIDPSTLTQAAILASPTALLASASPATSYHDAVASPDGTKAVFAVADAPGTYIVGTVTAGLTVNAVTKSRYSDAIGVAVSPDGNWCQIVRARTGSSTVTGDLLTFPALADSTISQALGATSPSATNSIAVAYSSVQVSGHYRANVFWSIPGGTTKTNRADTDGTIGTETTFKNWASVASRAFDYGGTVCVWLVFAQANSYSVGTTGGFYSLQNSFFLVDSTGAVHAKACANVASGSDTRPGSVTALGSGVYAWAGSVNRSITLASSSSKGYGARTPRLVTITFDDNQARRVARLGRTLYIAGGQLTGFDSVQLAEVGFPISPWYFVISATGGTGHASAGTYAVKATYRWDNAQGERERSTTTNIGSYTAALNDEIDIGYVKTTDLTLKGQTPAVEVWRTAVNPTADAPFYLATSLDPSVTANPNRYLSNVWTGGVIAGSTAAFTDQLSDASLTVKENNPENGDVLESIAPPACTIIAAGTDRLYLAGIAGAPYTVWYSRQRGTDEIASFNDALTVELPPLGGKITGLAFLNETLIVFKETAVYALAGDGFDNIGGGSNYGPPRVLASDVGAVSHEAIVLTPGGLIFKSAKGWYLLDRGWQAQYIGAPVATFDSDTVTGAHLMTAQHQVRITSASRVLVFDYAVGQWAEWTISGALGACLWSGSYLYLTSSGPQQEQSTFTAASYGIEIETPWIKLSDLQGYGRLRRIMLLGEYRSACTVRVRVARDYESDGAGSWAWFDDANWTASPAVVGGPLQLRHGPSRQQCEAIKVRLTVTPSPAGEAVQLTGLALECGIKRGLFKRLPAAQKD